MQSTDQKTCPRAPDPGLKAQLAHHPRLATGEQLTQLGYALRRVVKTQSIGEPPPASLHPSSDSSRRSAQDAHDDMIRVERRKRLGQDFVIAFRQRHVEVDVQRSRVGLHAAEAVCIDRVQVCIDDGLAAIPGPAIDDPRGSLLIGARCKPCGEHQGYGNQQPKG